MNSLNGAEKLTRVLTSETVHGLHDIDKLLQCDAIVRLWSGLVRNYLTVRVPCPVAWSSVLGAVVASICWKLDKSESDDQWEQDRRRGVNGRQIVTSRFFGSGKRHSTHC